MVCGTSETPHVDSGDQNTYSKNLNFSLDLGHANGIIDTSSPYQFNSNFFAPFAVQTEFDFAKLTFAERLQQQIRPKLGDGASRVGCGERDCSWMGVHVAICRGIFLLVVVRGCDGVGSAFLGGRLGHGDWRDSSRSWTSCTSRRGAWLGPVWNLETRAGGGVHGCREKQGRRENDGSLA